MPAVSLESNPLEVSVVLTHADEPWLQALSGEQITDGWLRYANEISAVGSTNMREATKAVRQTQTHCRAAFYEDLLGFAREDAPGYKLDEKILAKEGVHPPIDRFVWTMRLYERERINVVKAGRKFPDAWSMAPGTLESRVDELKRLLGAQNGQRLLQSCVEVLRYANYANKIKVARRVGTLVGWQHDQIDELILTKARLLTGSSKTLMLTAQYISEFATQDSTMSQVGNLLVENPDRHLIALDQHTPYTYSHIRKATQGLDTVACRVQAKLILANMDGSTSFSRQLLQRHRRWQAA